MWLAVGMAGAGRPSLCNNTELIIRSWLLQALTLSILSCWWRETKRKWSIWLAFKLRRLLLRETCYSTLSAALSTKSCHLGAKKISKNFKKKNCCHKNTGVSLKVNGRNVEKRFVVNVPEASLQTGLIILTDSAAEYRLNALCSDPEDGAKPAELCHCLPPGPPPSGGVDALSRGILCIAFLF